MKPNNVNTFLGLAALWLVLASSSLGAPSASSMHRRDILKPKDIGNQLLAYLGDMKQFVCLQNAMYFSTTEKKDRSENCFIYELEKIEKTCSTNTEDGIVSVVVDDVRRNANSFFQTSNYSISSCNGYEQKNVTNYINDFTNLVQWKNTMQS